MKGQNALCNLIRQMLEITEKHLKEPMPDDEYANKIWKSLQKADGIINQRKQNETNSRTAH